MAYDNPPDGGSDPSPDMTRLNDLSISMLQAKLGAMVMALTNAEARLQLAEEALALAKAATR
jgi:hypothetical protein